MYQVTKKRKGILFYLFLFVCAFAVGLGIGYARLKNRKPALPLTETPPSARMEQKQEPEQVASAHLPIEAEEPEETGYFVVEQDGKVCVFKVDADGLKRFSHFIPVELDALKEGDRALFQEGLPLETKEELLSLVEDFSS